MGPQSNESDGRAPSRTRLPRGREPRKSVIWMIPTDLTTGLRRAVRLVALLNLSDGPPLGPRRRSSDRHRRRLVPAVGRSIGAADRPRRPAASRRPAHRRSRRSSPAGTRRRPPPAQGLATHRMLDVGFPSYTAGAGLTRAGVPSADAARWKARQTRLSRRGSGQRATKSIW